MLQGFINNMPSSLDNGRYTNVIQIGKGGQGVALKAFDSVEKKEIVMKVVDFDIQNIQSLREGDVILGKIKHRNILECFGFINESYLTFMISEYCEISNMKLKKGGDLANYLFIQRRSPIVENCFLEWSSQIIKGLDYLHDHDILHRDLKPENIFIKENVMKIGDLGMAKIHEANNSIISSSTTNARGTKIYLCPEIVENILENSERISYSKYSDIWAFGCVMNEMITGKRTFRSMNDVREFSSSKLDKEEIRIKIGEEKKLSDKIIDLLSRVLTIERENRLKTAEIKLELENMKKDDTFDQPESSNPNANNVNNNNIDLEKIKCIRTLHGHTNGVWPFAISQEGFLCSGSLDTTIKIWNINSGKCLKTLKGHKNFVISLAISLEGYLCSGSSDNSIKIWNINSGECLRTLGGHTNTVTSLVISREGHLCSGSYDKSIKIWNVNSGECLSTFLDHTSPVSSLAISQEGFLCSGSWDASIKILNLNSGECLRALEGHKNVVSSLAISSEGYLCSGSWENSIKIWNLNSGECLRTLEGHGNWIWCLVVSPEGYLYSGSGDNSIKIWNINSGECLRTLEGHARSVYSLAISPEGHLCSGSIDHSIKIWK